MKYQLENWQGNFGAEYTERNAVDWQKRSQAFNSMLNGLSIKSALEAGCNKGHNLLCLHDLLGDACHLAGFDPNDHALEIARREEPKFKVSGGNLYEIPYPDNSFDLVFTAGVLIHIPLNDLEQAIKEIYRVSSKYIMAVEYYAEEETMIKYRDKTSMLWKRDFYTHYKNCYQELKLIREGFWNQSDGFDNTNWWLFEKP